MQARWSLLLVGGLATACSRSSATAQPGGEDAGTESGADAADDGSWPELPRTPSTLALSDIVGLAGGVPRGADAASVNQRAFLWTKMREAGIHRLRTDFLWDQIEPMRGTFNFVDYDRMVADATAHGVDLLPILDYGVTWATTAMGADNQYPPDDPKDFGAYAVAVASHYKGRITDYEIWNEPNIGFRFWRPTLNGDPAKFGALVLETAQELLASDPTLQVAYGGTAYMWLARGPDFVAQSLATTPGLTTAFNAFAMHAYSIYPPVRGPDTATAGEVPELDKIATMSGLLAAYGAPPVPIWITEIGWPTTTDDPPDQQARYMVRSVVLGALGGADRVFLYTLNDGPNPMAQPPEDAFGLVQYEASWVDGGAPANKPAFVAVRSLMTTLGAYSVTKRLPAMPSDVYVVELSNGARSAWIAWRALDAAPLTLVTLPAAGPVIVTHLDGSTMNDTAAAGGYTLQVGPDPMMVTGP